MLRKCNRESVRTECNIGQGLHVTPVDLILPSQELSSMSIAY